MKSQKMAPDPGFVMALGQKAVEKLLGEGTREMRASAFDNLLADAGEKYGVDPAAARREDAAATPDAESGSAPRDDGASQGMPPVDGPEMPGGPADSGPDSPIDGPDGPGGEGPEAPGIPVVKGPSGEGPDGGHQRIRCRIARLWRRNTGF